VEQGAAWLRRTSSARLRGRRRRREPCGQSGKHSSLRPSCRAAASRLLGLAAGAVRGRTSAVCLVSLEATRGIRKREKMEEVGSGGAAGTSGDGSDGGEQLRTVKHELRTGERPRPLPAGPGAGARLRAAGARAGWGRGPARRAPRGGSRAGPRGRAGGTGAGGPAMAGCAGGSRRKFS
jgi:hypothetical protein